MDTYNIYLCGIGGQGIITASAIIAYAALLDKFHVKQAEVHGMSQRGGSVESHVRFGKEIFSPIIENGKSDFIIPLDENEHDNKIFMLKENGIDLISTLQKGKKNIQNKKLVNSYMLGALSKSLPISEESWKNAFNKILKRMKNENIEIFFEGRNS